jgi:uncharacterized protein YacL
MSGIRSQQIGTTVSGSSLADSSDRRFLDSSWDAWVLRFVLLGASSFVCYAFRPFQLAALPAAAVGSFLAMLVLLAELRLRHVEFSGLVGGAVGALVGLTASLLVALTLSRTSEPEAAKSLFTFLALISLGYLGLALGARRGKELRNTSVDVALEAALPAPPPPSLMKILDTSVLIDGRIADICETHFLDGSLGVPRFVLHELQMVADSSDALKRQRGRHGLEVLQRMQKMPCLEIRVLDDDFSGISSVDQKLVELARRTGAKIVTNDFNLNKVARVQNISVLNVNELANALKPAVLPGESMRVLILREGKEPTQGVAFLDDGTMVVVDGARRLINRTVDIVVTSVHQTPAGKMIFGRLDERADPGAVRAAAAAGGSVPRAEGAIGGNGHSPRQTRAESSRALDASPGMAQSDPDIV